MLDGNRYYSEFPEEREPVGQRPVVSTQLLATLRTIEQEISHFIRIGADDVASIAPMSVERDEDASRGSHVSPPGPAKPQSA
jgi:hypothetical protein